LCATSGALFFTVAAVLPRGVPLMSPMPNTLGSAVLQRGLVDLQPAAGGKGPFLPGQVAVLHRVGRAHRRHDVDEVVGHLRFSPSGVAKVARRAPMSMAGELARVLDVDAQRLPAPARCR
jgi:hypothetical protein